MEYILSLLFLILPKYIKNEGENVKVWILIYSFLFAPYIIFPRKQDDGINGCLPRARVEHMLFKL